MTVEWPFVKHDELCILISATLALPRPHLTPKSVASILGKIRSVAAISNWGPFMSHSLQSSLAASTRRALLNSASAHTWWWQRGQVWLSSAKIKDLTLLRDWLTSEDVSQLWIHPIGMLVHHQSHAAFYSDASYAGLGGLGGWSPHAQLQ
jgi:hypothetical protein